MLHKLNETTVSSDAGFEVEVILHDWILEYREKDRVLQMEMGLAGGKGLLIDSETGNRWNTPFDGKPITESERATIVDRIKEALTLLSGEFTIA